MDERDLMMMYVADPTYSCKEPNDFKLTAQANAKRIRKGDNEEIGRAHV